MDLFNIQSKTLHTTEVRLTRQKMAKTSGSPNVNIGQITAAFHSPGTTAVARELLNKFAEEVVLEGGDQPLEQYKVQLFMAWALWFVKCGEPVMDKARCNNTGMPINTDGLGRAGIGYPLSVRKTA